MGESTAGIQDWMGRDVVDVDGHKIGTVEDMYYDDPAGKPVWVLVKTGLFGTAHSFVPATEMWPKGDKLTVPYTKGKVNDAPRIEGGEELSEADERLLYSYYGLRYLDPDAESLAVPRPCDLVRLSGSMKEQPLGFMAVASEDIACDEEPPAGS